MIIIANLLVINGDTGEIQSDVVVRTIKQQEIIRQFYQKKETNSLYEPQGRFCFFLFDSAMPLMPFISLANITRVFYLSTFMGYDNYLRHSNNKFISYDWLEDKLKLSKRQYQSFIQECKRFDIFEDKSDKGIFLSKHFYFRGGLTQKRRNTKSFIRIYRNGIRDIFDNMNLSTKKLGYVFRLIPYVNMRHNLLCTNPFEEDFEKVIPFPLNELCGIFDYSKSNISKLLNELSCYCFSDRIPILKIQDIGSLNQKGIIINPRLFYGGDYNSYREVSKIFGT